MDWDLLWLALGGWLWGAFLAVACLFLVFLVGAYWR